MKAWVTTLIAAAGLAAAPAWAQQRDGAPPEEPAPREAAPDEREPAADEGEAEPQDADEQGEAQGEGLPDLDELLGLEESEAPETPGDGDADPQERALERALTDQEVSDQFKQAVQEMRDAAALLDTARDPGLRTQRIQEDVLKKLDALIEQARNQSQQQQSSPRPQDQQQQRRPGQQQQQQQQQQANQGDNRQERLPPGRRDGPLGDLVDSESAAWGALPPRVRDTLLQGASDRFSSLYEAMTEAYYRRLAEEATDR